MQIRAEPEKTALPICNYSQILYQFLTFTQNLKRSRSVPFYTFVNAIKTDLLNEKNRIVSKNVNPFTIIKSNRIISITLCSLLP